MLNTRRILVSSIFLALTACSNGGSDSPTSTTGGGGGGTDGDDNTSTGSSFSEFIATPVYRDKGTTQQTLADERTTGLAIGLRMVPDVTKDDDGYHQQTNGGSQLNGAACTAAGGSTQTCSPVTWQQAARPTTNCGSTGTVTARITDCATANPSAHSWSGKDSATSGEGTWSLVTRLADSSGRTYEVWRDDRTKLLWSDRVGNLSANNNTGTFNWCLASGNTQGAAAGGTECQASTASSYNNMAISLCADDDTGPLTTPDGVHDATTANGLTYWGYSGADTRNETDQNSVARAKGNLTSIKWRLPTRSDYMQAMINGLAFVVPNVVVSGSVTGFHWTSTLVSNNRAQAWSVNLSLGRITEAARTNSYAVRCVGSGE